MDNADEQTKAEERKREPSQTTPGALDAAPVSLTSPIAFDFVLAKHRSTCIGNQK
jgi:hypothetical protein